MSAPRTKLVLELDVRSAYVDWLIGDIESHHGEVRRLKVLSRENLALDETPLPETIKRFDEITPEHFMWFFRTRGPKVEAPLAPFYEFYVAEWRNRGLSATQPAVVLAAQRSPGTGPFYRTLSAFYSEIRQRMQPAEVGRAR